MVADSEVVVAGGGQPADRLGGDDRRRRLEAGRRQVLRDHRLSASRACRSHERRVLGAARQRLDAHRAGAGEEVEHPRTLDRAHRSERVERGLTHPVARRSRVAPDGGKQLAPPGLTRDDAHVRNVASTPMGDAITVVRIDQPRARNAINSETAQRLHDAFVAFDADPDAKVAVLTGDEEAFCAGANLKDLPDLRPSGPLGPTRLQLSKPVIAAVEGWCVAGGRELAAGCDLRVAGDTATFGCLERRWGVPLIDGGTYRLPRIVGLGRALDMILTGRQVDAREAERIGLVDRLVTAGTALEQAVALAEQIAESPWLCVGERPPLRLRRSRPRARRRPSPTKTASAARRSSPATSRPASRASRTATAPSRGCRQCPSPETDRVRRLAAAPAIASPRIPSSAGRPATSSPTAAPTASTPGTSSSTPKTSPTSTGRMSRAEPPSTFGYHPNPICTPLAMTSRSQQRALGATRPPSDAMRSIAA